MENSKNYAPPETDDLVAPRPEPRLIDLRAQAIASVVSVLGAAPQIASLLDALLPLIFYRYLIYSFWVTPFLAGLVAALVARSNSLINAAAAGLVWVAIFALLVTSTVLGTESDVRPTIGVGIVFEFGGMLGSATLGGVIVVPLRNGLRRRARRRKYLLAAQRSRPTVVFDVGDTARSDREGAA